MATRKLISVYFAFLLNVCNVVSIAAVTIMLFIYKAKFYINYYIFGYFFSQVLRIVFIC